MMKKLLSSVAAVTILFGWLFAVSSASANNNDCKQVDFSNGTVCVSIENVSSNKFKLVTDKEDSNVGTLRCDIMLPDSTLKSIAACNGTFTFDDGESGRIKLRIRANEEAPEDWEDKPSNSSTWTYPQWMYDFSNEERLDSNLDTNDDNNDNSDNLYITASPSSPSENEDVDITIKARNGSSTDTSYRGTVRFKVEKKSGSSSWTTASSSYYDLARTSYTFTSSDRGTHSFSNLVTFTNDAYDYRLVATDSSNDIVGYKTFYLDGGNNNTSNGDLDNFYLSTDDTTPTTSQYVDLRIEARDNNDDTVTDYTDLVNFKIYKRASGSSSWTTASSSTDYTMDSDYTDGYDFTSSDDGDVTLTDFIKFKRTNYSYKIRVEDDNDTSIYKEITFTVGNTNNNTNGDLDNFYLSTDDTTPSTSQYVDLRIEARDSNDDTVTDYTDLVNFKIYKRASGSSSWTTASSSTDYTMDSDYTDGYDFTSSDDGDVTLTDFIKFKRTNYSYKIRVEDDNDTSIYKEITFTVGSVNNTNNGDLDNFYLSTDDTTPSTTQYIDLRIQARDSNDDTVTDYTDTVKFRVYKRASSSSSWTIASSSTDYTLNSDYTDGYDFTSSDDGDVNLTDFVRFKKNNYSYKVRVYDESDASIYKEITFTVGSVSNNSSTVDGFTSTELSNVRSIYNSRNNMINELEDNYSKLRNSTTWKNRSDTFYDDMQDILDDANNKTYDTYDEFLAGWSSWYSYTINLR